MTVRRLCKIKMRAAKERHGAFDEQHGVRRFGA